LAFPEQGLAVLGLHGLSLFAPQRPFLDIIACLVEP
jgi:hypothetical protein